jgi:hypothetical protein
MNMSKVYSKKTLHPPGDDAARGLRHGYPNTTPAQTLMDKFHGALK